jgi:hypothetical protein
MSRRPHQRRQTTSAGSLLRRAVRVSRRRFLHGWARALLMPKGRRPKPSRRNPDDACGVPDDPPGERLRTAVESQQARLAPDNPSLVERANVGLYRDAKARDCRDERGQARNVGNLCMQNTASLALGMRDVDTGSCSWGIQCCRRKRAAASIITFLVGHGGRFMTLTTRLLYASVCVESLYRNCWYLCNARDLAAAERGTTCWRSFDLADATARPGAVGNPKVNDTDFAWNE